MSYNINTVLKITGLLGHSPVTFLLDSGATISVVRLDALTADFRSQITTSRLTTPVGANGSPLDMVGQVKIPVTIGRFSTEQVFTVVNTLTVDCLLGSDFLISQEVLIDYKNGTVSLKGNVIPFSMSNSNTTPIQEACSRSVSAFQTTTIPGRTIQLLSVSLPTEALTLGYSSVLIEPQDPDRSPSHTLIARTFSSVSSDSLAIIQIMNTSPTPVTIYQGTTLGQFTPVSELLLVELQQSPLPATYSPAIPADIDLAGSVLSPDQKRELLKLLSEYRDLFATDNRSLGRTSVVKHTIHTDGHPIRQPVRRQPRALQDAIDTEVQQMLQNGVIRPSFSPWSSPVVMVKKQDGSWRFCVDYRKLNSVTHRDAYPLPRIDSTLDSLAGAQLFTTLDLASGYWQVEMEPTDKQKTAFSTTQGHFEFNVMPFGLTNAPPTFQRLMQCVLAGLSGTHCLVYLDDIIVFSTTFEEHLQRLVSVFERLRAAGLKLKPKKCHFAKRQITYLGHVISANGVEPDHKKLAAVTTYPAPCSKHEVKRFLGLSNYYRRFISQYAQIAEPLNRLLRKTSKTFTWTPECDTAFNALKAKLTSPPILTYPCFSDPFIVLTDASDKAIGGVLSQMRHNQEKVIAYWSRQLTKAERNYSTIEREALAAVGAIKEFYPYLYGFSFKLVTDHNPLTSLKGLKDTGGRLARWLLFLQQFNFTVEYKKGSRHTNADTLSRQPPDHEVTTLVTGASLTDPQVLIKAQLADPQLSTLKLQLQEGTTLLDCPTGLRKCFLQDGLICRTYKDSTTQLEHTQIVIPGTLKHRILEEIHNRLGHFGAKKTLERLKTRYYWPGYEQDTVQWVKQCEQCQKRNPPQPNPVAPLGTITASRPFEKLLWDIMGPLPMSSQGNKYILVITDLFTKWVEAFPLKDTTATTLATIMLNEVVCRYGVPTSLHSDQGANLCSSVVYSLCELLGIATTRTSAYHPQGNGQVERFNRTLQSILAKTVDANQDTWDSQLPKALFAYRTAVHDTTGFTPFHLTFARSPQLPVDVMLGRILPAKSRSYPQFVQEAHKQMKSSCNIAQEHLRAQHLWNKQIYDKDNTAVQFCVGDRVWLYTPVVSKGKTKKFTSFWKGPYTIVDKPGKVDYKIQLIGGTQTIIVHRNRLKLCYTPPQPTNAGSSKSPFPSDSHDTLPTPSPDLAIGGYTTLDLAVPDSRPARNRRPPSRFNDYIRY